MLASAVDTLFESLQQGARALAASRRLARQVERRYADWQLRHGATAWAAPRVEHYEDWLHGRWQAAFEHTPHAPVLLSDDQELLLWERVIEQSQLSGTREFVMQVSTTARAARQSWRRMHEWELSWRRLGERRFTDTAAFQEWSGTVRQILDERGWLTAAQLPAYLFEHPAGWVESEPPAVWWLGFDALPDALHRLRDLLEARGSEQHHFDGAVNKKARTTVIECRDGVDQWNRIARWARATLEHEPEASLGVVCPDLHGHQEDIEEILDDVLNPELAWRVDAPRAFHLSLGRPLADYPIAGAALDLLQWCRPRVTFEVVSRVLRSPYLAGGESELGARAGLEMRLRKLQQDTFTLKSLHDLAVRQGGLDALARCLDAARATPLAERQDASAWAAAFAAWLSALGWPGNRSLDSRELQVMNAWHDLLSRFAMLSTVEQRWRREPAIQKLSAMASARILQFHDDDAPLQIMGASEAPGLWFDALWLADMSDAAWPPPARPDPFIPVSLQKTCAMPEASAPAMMARARVRTQRMLTSAPRVRVSYAGTTEEAPAALSPLFDQPDAPSTSAAADSGQGYEGRTRQLMRAAPALEAVADHQAPPLAGGLLRGGVSLVADQALCPFRALTHHRLQARGLDEVIAGLSPAQRGELTHDALKRFWDEVETQHALNAMAEEALQQQAARCVDAALSRWLANSSFRKQLLALESERLTALLLEWLTLERRRGPFRVLATEAAARLALDEAQLDVRVDRIDELGDGRRLIIDYKTGQLISVRAWMDERIEEPQLPMYALAMADRAAALALAGVRRGGCELRGIADSDVAGLEPLTPVHELGMNSVDQLKDRWATLLGERVAEHRRGEAAVAPKHSQACRYCDAMALCRVFERVEPLD